ncbi:hypothetical protein [Mesoplasma melaleucae]|uniref:Uncharacterized protein n=1 Tax=Mesoplasma melaleucae TaxID=81459 RepID=A0A2K8NVX4_9MOLU|nr:hypothetical protein [Mesoplasma melaleucae]ATZ17982.1 hypothetical protein EMELA_v1c04310 [Mesoplasma melaleucae]
MSNQTSLNKNIKLSEKEIQFRDLKIQRFVLKEILELVTKAGYDKTNLHFALNEGIGRDSYQFMMFTKEWINSVINDVELMPIKPKEKDKAKEKLMLISELYVVKEKCFKTYEINQDFFDKIISNLLAKGKLPSIRKIIKKLFIKSYEINRLRNIY